MSHTDQELLKELDEVRWELAGVKEDLVIVREELADMEKERDSISKELDEAEERIRETDGMRANVAALLCLLPPLSDLEDEFYLPYSDLFKIRMAIEALEDWIYEGRLGISRVA